MPKSPTFFECDSTNGSRWKCDGDNQDSQEATGATALALVCSFHFGWLGGLACVNLNSN